MFGYMINEMGYCISSLRKNREAVDRDLFVVEKLRKHYKMGEELTRKVRSYLLDARPKLDQVQPEEEQGILLKLNEEVREGKPRPTQKCCGRTRPPWSVPPSFSSADGRATFRTPFRSASCTLWPSPTTSSINPQTGKGFTS
jgi:hypothetical protein